MTPETISALFQKNLPESIKLNVQTPQQELALSLASAIADKRCRVDLDKHPIVYQILPDLISQHMSDNWQQLLTNAAIDFSIIKEPAMGKMRVAFDKNAADNYVIQNFPQVDDLFNTILAGLEIISPSQLQKILETAHANTELGGPIIDQKELQKILGGNQWQRPLSRSGLDSRGDKHNDATISNAGIETLQALHHELLGDLVLLVARSAPPAALSPEQALALLQSPHGDVETTETVTSRIRARTRHTEESERSFVVTLPTNRPFGGEFEAFLKDLSIKPEQLDRLKGMAITNDDGTVSVPKISNSYDDGIVEISMPIEPIEQVAGKTWLEANTHLARVTENKAPGRP